MSVIPHLAVPYRVDGTAGRVVEQDTVDEVAQNVAVIIATPLYARPVVPGFGVPDPTFRQEVGVEAMRSAVAEWEPRAHIVSIDGPAGAETLDFIVPTDHGDREVTLTVEKR